MDMRMHCRALTSGQSHRKSGLESVQNLSSEAQEPAPIHFVNFGRERLLSPLSRCVIMLMQAYNPQRKVHLWSSREVKADELSAPWLSNNLTISTHIIDNDAADLFRGTPLDDWYDRHLFFHRSSGPGQCRHMMGQNIANGLRILLLWRYGGVYMDSDIIPIQQLPVQWVRAVSAQKPGHPINNAALFFPKNDSCLHTLMLLMNRTFSPCSWGPYGPKLFSRVFNGRRTPAACRKVSILPPWTFQPIPYTAFRARKRSTRMQSVNATVIQRWRARKVVGVHVFTSLGSTQLRQKYTEVQELQLAGECLSMPRPDTIN
mmetsp:Transcript_25105/g.48750  ORF Transcript_25105/g.48750 Transcript_25105/m.48750 type:complete len:317 (+) Transcript_25105:538-1488(+)